MAKTVKFEIEMTEEELKELEKFWGDIDNPADSKEECIRELFWAEGYMYEFDIRRTVKVRMIK